MYRLSVFILTVGLLTVRALAKGKLVEWDFNLLAHTNASNSQANCKQPYQILDPPGHYAGYYSIDGTKDGHIFYMYFENRNKDPDAPFVFWTNGGPGCSSFFGLFLENGPYEIQEDLSLCWKEYGWDVGHNIVFVEQPIGVGYSYSSSSEDQVTTEEQVGDNMVQFFYAFLKAHPELAKKDLFISGESFGGHYLPAIAKSILKANAEKKEIHLNLKATIIGNPWTNPASQFRSYPYYAQQNELITKRQRHRMLKSLYPCQFRLLLCDLSFGFLQKSVCNTAYDFCNSVLFEPILTYNPLLNYYDIRRSDCYIAGCYNIKLMTRFLNTPAVQAKIGADKSIQWEDCKNSVWDNLDYDLSKDTSHVVGDILDAGIKVFVYAGDQDLICNYLGNERWVNRMRWKGARDWASAKEVDWISERKFAGTVRQTDLLTFMRVYNSGHMVPMDQPAIALDMLTTYTRGRPFKSQSTSLKKQNFYDTT
eukprot:g4661.t1